MSEKKSIFNLSRPHVFIPMCVDIFHHGHINILLKAKKLGNTIVGLMTDKGIKNYKGKAPSTVYKEMPFDYKLTTKEEVNMFIEGDEDVRKLQYKIEYVDQCLNYLDGVLRQINNRNFQIKNAIDWTKFQNGV